MSVTIPEMEAYQGKVLNCPPCGGNSSRNLPNLPPKEKQLYVNRLSMHGSTNNIQSHDYLSPNLAFNSNVYATSLSNSPAHVPFHVLAPITSSSVSAGSPFIELCDRKPVMSCEKKLRRMISNRESARRSRIRRKKQIEELQTQVNQLQTMNNHLAEKVISLLESNQHILRENSQLHETISSLQITITELLAPLRNVAETREH